MSIIKTNEHKSLEQVAAENLDPAIFHEDLSFQPSPIQQSLKAQFWARFIPGPLDDPKKLTLPLVQSIVNDAKLKRYWNLPGFKEWFSNQNENVERVEYLWAVGLDAAEQILRDSSTNPAVKVNLLKLLADVTGRLSSKNRPVEEKYADEAINKMSQDELKEWLSKKGVTVTATYDVKPKGGEDV